MSVPPNIVIDGATYVVSPLPTWRGFELQLRILPAAIDIMTAIAKVWREGLLEADVGEVARELGPALSDLVARVFQRLPPAEFSAVARELLQLATCNGQALFGAAGNPIDVLLQQKTATLWPLLWHAIRVNYPDVFRMRPRPAAGASANAEAAPSGTPTT